MDSGNVFCGLVRGFVLQNAASIGSAVSHDGHGFWSESSSDVNHVISVNSEPISIPAFSLIEIVAAIIGTRKLLLFQPDIEVLVPGQLSISFAESHH